MQMTREDFNKNLSEILTLSGAEGAARISAILDEIRTDRGSLTADLENSKKVQDGLQRINDDLVKQNMALFLKVGNVPPPGSDHDDGSDKPRFEDLFDPKTGKLK